MGRFDGKTFSFRWATNEACGLFALSINEHANEADGAILLGSLPAIHQFLLPSNLRHSISANGNRSDKRIVQSDLLTLNQLGST
jgi:hypothetical protein